MQSGELLVLKREQVADMLQVSQDTVSNLHRTRQLVAVKVGRSLRWRPDDIAEFVKSLRQGGE